MSVVNLSGTSAANPANWLAGLFDALTQEGYTVHPNDAAIGTGTASSPAFDSTNIADAHLVFTRSSWVLDPVNNVNLWIRAKAHIYAGGAVLLELHASTAYDTTSKDILNPVFVVRGRTSTTSNDYSNQVAIFVASEKGFTVFTQRYTGGNEWDSVLYFGKLMNFDYTPSDSFGLVYYDTVSDSVKIEYSNDTSGSATNSLSSGEFFQRYYYDSIVQAIQKERRGSTVHYALGNASSLNHSPKVRGNNVRRIPVAPYPLDTQGYFYFLPDTFFLIPPGENVRDVVDFNTPDGNVRSYKIISTRGAKIALWNNITAPAS